jgi:hypothetical protein
MSQMKKYICITFSRSNELFQFSMYNYTQIWYLKALNISVRSFFKFNKQNKKLPLYFGADIRKYENQNKI